MFQEADDQEMRELAREEVKDLEERIKATEERLALLLIPKDPMDEKNVMLEIRAGTGGGEAAIWAGDLALEVSERGKVVHLNRTLLKDKI